MHTLFRQMHTTKFGQMQPWAPNFENYFDVEGGLKFLTIKKVQRYKSIENILVSSEPNDLLVTCYYE